jgi:hypothetical protein
VGAFFFPGTRRDGSMEFGGGRQGGEADECTCAQCRGVGLEDWLGRVAEHEVEVRKQDAREG